MDLLNYILAPEDSRALFQELKFNPVVSFHDYERFPWIEEAMTYIAEGRVYLNLSLPGAVTDETAKLIQSYYLKDVSQEQIIEILDRTRAKAVKAGQ